jgi:hypothetical protein
MRTSTSVSVGRDRVHTWLQSVVAVILGGLLAAAGGHLAHAEESSGDAGHRAVALEAYYERCDVDPDSQRGVDAASEWEGLAAATRFTPAQIAEIAQELDPGCPYPSFRAAIVRFAKEREEYREDRSESLGLYRRDCHPSTESDDRAEEDWDRLMRLRDPDPDADDVHDDAMLLGIWMDGCRDLSFYSAILEVEYGQLKTRRTGLLIGGGILTGLGAASVVIGAASTDGCAGGLECLGHGLGSYFGVTLGVAAVITGGVFLLASHGEKKRMDRLDFLLAEEEARGRADIQLTVGHGGVTLRF